ncbi:P-loop containing nucleoside triphosphate hydrolase protein [Mycena rebaudengoi]|nr:P-loop containing nucleoside triphosphate hydrolase protein [Mycena rebaudengoi]
MSRPFAGMNIILFGDPHQFPPVADEPGALYCPTHKKNSDLFGSELFSQFTTVVTLTEQMRIVDPPWMELLRRLREGACTEDDLDELRKLRVGDPRCAIPKWEEDPWDKAVLVTPRHGARMRWNTAAVQKHSKISGNRMYICTAEDTRGAQEEKLTLEERILVAGMTTKQSGKLAEQVELCVGMRAMVLLNLATEKDLANGTRGTIVDIKLDPREPRDLLLDENTGATLLQYPPALVLFKPDHCSFPPFEGLPEGVLPIVPTRRGFHVYPHGKKTLIHRRQFGLTAAYAFTDYKSQGQTLEYVLVDLEPPPSFQLTPFSAYVALSRSRGRSRIRLLRGFQDKLFTTHPSRHLAQEDERLEQLEARTAGVLDHL